MMVIYLLMVISGNVRVIDAFFVKKKRQLTERNVIAQNQVKVVVHGVRAELLQYELHAKIVKDVTKKPPNQVQNIKLLQKMCIKLFLIIKKVTQQHLMEYFNDVGSVKVQVKMDVTEDVKVQQNEKILLVVASEFDHVA